MDDLDLRDFSNYCRSREEWDAIREDMAGETFERQAALLSLPVIFWENAIQWMDEPEEVKKAFMDDFMKPESFTARLNATMGVATVNRAPAQGLIDDAREIKRRMEAGQECKTALLLLGALVVDLVDGEQHTTLGNAAKLLKGDYKAPKKGAFAQTPGQVWKAFCQYYLDTGALPTKKKLDELAGIEDGRKIRGPLGLNGLPEQW